MKYEEFITKFNKQVFSMDYDKQLTLTIEVCKTLYFDYVAFLEKYKWGNKGILLNAITFVEQSRKNIIGQGLIDKTLRQLETITPGMDDFGNDELATYASNACVAVYNSVQFIIDKRPKLVYDIGICLTDTIDFKIQEQQNLTEQEINNNPLMIKARKYLIDNSK